MQSEIELNDWNQNGLRQLEAFQFAALLGVLQLKLIPKSDRVQEHEIIQTEFEKKLDKQEGLIVRDGNREY